MVVELEQVVKAYMSYSSAWKSNSEQFQPPSTVMIASFRRCNVINTVKLNSLNVKFVRSGALSKRSPPRFNPIVSSVTSAFFIVSAHNGRISVSRLARVSQTQSIKLCFGPIFVLLNRFPPRFNSPVSFNLIHFQSDFNSLRQIVDAM